MTPLYKIKIRDIRIGDRVGRRDYLGKMTTGVVSENRVSCLIIEWEEEKEIKDSFESALDSRINLPVHCSDLYYLEKV